MRLSLCAILGVTLLAAIPPVRAADDDELVKQIKQLNTITGDDAVREKFLSLIKDKPNAAKLLKKAEEMAKLDSKQFKYNASRVLALTAHQLKDFDKAERFYKIGERQALDVKSATKIIETFEGQIRILYAQKKYEAAEELCQKILGLEINDDLDRMKIFVVEELIQVLTRQGKVERALELANKLVETEDSSWYFMRVKAWVLHEAGRSEESAKAYLSAIDLLEKNENLKPEQQESLIDEIRYRLSNVYIELGQVEKSAEQLKALLKRKPDHPSYNNDLGYIWADHDMNLDEAERLIRKALDEDRKKREELKSKGELDPDEDKDNAAYLDSLGWVLFKKKQYEEAKKALLEAVSQKDGEHLEIMDHLADVHMALGEKDEAIAVWKKALELDASSRRDLRRRAEVLKKLKAVQGDSPADAKPAEPGK